MRVIIATNSPTVDDLFAYLGSLSGFSSRFRALSVENPVSWVRLFASAYEGICSSLGIDIRAFSFRLTLGAGLKARKISVEPAKLLD